MYWRHLPLPQTAEMGPDELTPEQRKKATRVLEKVASALEVQTKGKVGDVSCVSGAATQV